MTAPELLDLVDRMGDARIAASGLLLAIRGANLCREEKDALAAWASSLEDRLSALTTEVEGMYGSVKKEGGE